MKKEGVCVAGATSRGTQHAVNQDAYLYRTAQTPLGMAGVFTVADGIGSLKYSEHASSIAVDTIGSWWDNTFFETMNDHAAMVESLMHTVRQANAVLVEFGAQNGLHTGTTLSTLVLLGGRFIIVHVGDSRIYRIPHGSWTPAALLTQDHSGVVCMPNRDGASVYKNVLTQCVGVRDEMEIYLSEGYTQARDTFVVCSDGVYKSLSGPAIVRLVRRGRGQLASTCDKIIDLARKNGEKDDITLVLAQMSGL